MGRGTTFNGVLAMALFCGSASIGADHAKAKDLARPSSPAELPHDYASGRSQTATVSLATGISVIRLERPVGSVAVDNAAELGSGPILVRARPVSSGTVASSLTGQLRLASLVSNMPFRGHVTSAFGMRRHPMDGIYKLHSGVDLAAPYGTAIQAPAGGLVKFVGWLGGYGMMVEIDHGGAATTRYAHLLRAAVSQGQAVKQGQVIGYVGTSGRSTGALLHFELRQAGRPVNPLGK